ncbi:hypothetical protein ADK43_29470 [Streptomyces rimosus subsp. rimosus]|nr:hypothetical protein ADK43_29470 [Streptomyces rimosus subsp. rimosus]
MFCMGRQPFVALALLIGATFQWLWSALIASTSRIGRAWGIIRRSTVSALSLSLVVACVAALSGALGARFS